VDRDAAAGDDGTSWFVPARLASIWLSSSTAPASDQPVDRIHDRAKPGNVGSRMLRMRGRPRNAQTPQARPAFPCAV
jgi:hypothetical protein